MVTRLTSIIPVRSSKSAMYILTKGSLSSSEKLELIRLLEEKGRRKRTNKLNFYSPYARQVEFHDAGAEFSERLFMAGNQLGKTVAGGAEWAMHLTGRYPKWWEGATFDNPPLL